MIHPQFQSNPTNAGINMGAVEVLENSIDSTSRGALNSY
jgi:hypothetical protein